MSTNRDHAASAGQAEATYTETDATQTEQANADAEASNEPTNAEKPEASGADAGEPADAAAGGANEWEKQIDQWRKQVEEHQQRLLRVQADFDNFRRRTRVEKEEFAKYASLKIVEQLLPVLDNFERALSASKDNKDADALAKGVEMIFRQLEQVLAQEGVQPMETVGEPFNPEFHQAIMQVDSDEYAEGTVVEELQKGYMLKDKVIRPAMVKVSK